MKTARLPEKFLYCGGPVLIETAHALVKARRDVQGEAV
jgi:iron complex transport system substrate-binding protein